MIRPLRAMSAWVVAALAAGVVACGLELPQGLAPDAQQLADDAVDGQDTISIATALAGLPSLVLTADSLSLAEAVERQAEIAAYFDEDSCVSVEAEGNTVTYNFDTCTGPWGLVTVSGRETVVFSPGPTADSFELTFASDGLEINGNPAEHSGTAIITLFSDRRTIDFSGEYKGTALLGPRKVHHEIDFALELRDSGALSIDGSSSTTVGLRGLELDVRDLERPGPKGTCPSGVVVAKRKLSPLEITLTFDGSPELLVESSLGGHDTFDLECEPES